VPETDDLAAPGVHGDACDVGQRAPDLRRVVVVGTSGSGKTTLAKALAEALDAVHVELDALHWEPGWQEAERDVFRARVDRATRGPHWVCDGNYSSVRDLVWTRASCLVWLDLPFATVFARAVGRTFRRALTREALFGGENRERVWGFLDPDWIPWWVIRTWRKNRRRYAALVDAGAFAPLDVVRLRTPTEVRRFSSDHASPPDPRGPS
jgi:adenylate kinase family enzyme